MIQGEFDDEGKLFFIIDLIDTEGEPIEVNAMLDTGFTDWLAMNNEEAETLGWILVDSEQLMRTAQGEARFNIYQGKVCIDGQEFNIPVLGGEQLSLIGLPVFKFAVADCYHRCDLASN
ncbi:aspartyl protease [Scytonema sp. UIC 10036]|uniref:aspartyl protease n=1 Tax=Scytonema sp. UIC 10036 TaxID=2304196 RepID=UPI001A9C2025|nr:aspartyl protease [Scytonema sp. UIC 10036]